jgi:hypothetical protein
MKKVITLLSTVCFSASLFAQSSLVIPKNISKPRSYGTHTKALPISGFETNQTTAVSVPPSYLVASRFGLEDLIGSTLFDLQTNGSMPRRMVRHADNRLSASFTFSKETTYLDRGTGYNTRTAAGVWQAEPTARIENVRTGFSNLLVLANGTEVSIAHPNAGGPVVSLKPQGQTNWTNTTLPAPVPSLWYRAAADGNYIHIIGVTLPRYLQGGALYKGVDGHLLYWRSSDGGNTWDKAGTIIPGLDSTMYKSMSGDSYAIDAQDGRVAFALFNDWNDSRVFMSDDNGNTWSNHLIWDFPLDNYLPGTSSYTVVDLPSDPNAPDTLAIRTTDESGALIIDDAGIIHFAFGSRYVIDNDFTDTITEIFEPISGLIYGNSLDWEVLKAVAFPLDLNGNDTIDIIPATYQPYNGKCTESYPIFSIDDAGGIQLLYSGAREGAVDQAGQVFRHIYRLISTDFGTTWTEPQDLIDEVSVGDQFTADLTEAVYPSAPRRVGNELCLSYQADFDAGLGVQNTHADVENTIKCFCVSTVKTSNVLPQSLKFVVNPNPADQEVIISFNLKEAALGQIEIVNMVGQTVSATNRTNFESGSQQFVIKTNHLPNGLFFARLTVGRKTATQKLVVNHSY